ncbi:MAG: cation:proton antiporter [Burkholderiales bacterium]|jgi:NhaP-type Na+/H+ or K+/H+ antiporter
MSAAGWSLFAGALLVSLVLLGTLVERLPVSAALLYLATGWMLGPDLANVLTPDPMRHAAMLERIAEVALLISLFAAGLQLGVPLRDRRWSVPIRLATLSMVAMVAMIAAVGVWLLDLPVGAAVLLGAILAPTDPVLASGIHAEPGAHPDRLGFSLAGEGGLNDGVAFPFVMLGLGLLGRHDLGTGWARWWTVDLGWATVGGMAIGAALGTLAGRLVVHLRARHGEAVGLDVFLSLGLVALGYGLAQWALASGFLAVFACGLALRRVDESHEGDGAPLSRPVAVAGHPYETLATHPQHASATMRAAVQLFNGQLEKLAELALVLLVGAMLAYAPLRVEALWFVPLVLLLLRPLSALPVLVGEGLDPPQRRMIAWFGIRGIGSVFYLLLVLRHDVGAATAELLTSLVLWTVAASIVVHGVTAHPLMRRYLVDRAPR